MGYLPCVPCPQPSDNPEEWPGWSRDYPADHGRYWAAMRSLGGSPRWLTLEISVGGGVIDPRVWSGDIAFYGPAVGETQSTSGYRKDWHNNGRTMVWS